MLTLGIAASAAAISNACAWTEVVALTVLSADRTMFSALPGVIARGMAMVGPANNAAKAHESADVKRMIEEGQKQWSTAR